VAAIIADVIGGGFMCVDHEAFFLKIDWVMIVPRGFSAVHNFNCIYLIHRKHLYTLNY